MTDKKHILSILVDNEPGVLSRIAGLFSGRGYNIESLCVAETNDAKISRLTMVTAGDSIILEQIKKQLNKLINVIKVSDLTGQDYVERELVLIKVNAKLEHRAEILRINDIFRGRVVDVGPEHYIISVTGDSNKVNAIVNLLKPYGIKEIARTGSIALYRDNQLKT
jgi:acetolactate synthase I/III small subunit